MTSSLSGVISANLTPFVSEQGAIDDPWVPSHLRFLESQGMHGILTLGTTGEGPSLGLDERKQMLDVVLNHRGNLFVLAGTGCAALSDTIALSRYALERGADAVLLMPPFYFRSVRDEGVLHYFRAVYDALSTDARVLLYHIPAVTGVAITSTVIDGLLASHGRQFYGIKDSSGDPQHTEGLVCRYPQLHIYSGSDRQVGRSLAAGVAGAISAFSNVWPHLVRAVWDAYQQGGDIDAPQARLTQVREIVPEGVPVPPALKALLPLVSGLPWTSVRVPLVNLSDSEVRPLQESVPQFL